MNKKQKLPKHIAAHQDISHKAPPDSIVLVNLKNKKHLFVEDRFDNQELALMTSRLDADYGFDEDGPYCCHIGKQIVF